MSMFSKTSGAFVPRFLYVFEGQQGFDDAVHVCCSAASSMTMYQPPTDKMASLPMTLQRD